MRGLPHPVGFRAISPFRVDPPARGIDGPARLRAARLFVELAPLVLGPDGGIDVGRVSPQPRHRGPVAGYVAEGVPPEETARVLPGDLVDLLVGAARRHQLVMDKLRGSRK